MAEDAPQGGFTSVTATLAKISDPTDLGVLFVGGGLGGIGWFLLSLWLPVLAVMAPSVAAGFIAVSVLGLKKLAIDGPRKAARERQERQKLEDQQEGSRKIAPAAMDRWRRYSSLLLQDIDKIVERGSALPGQPSVGAVLKLIRRAESFGRSVESGLVSNEDIHEFINLGLAERELEAADQDLVEVVHYSAQISQEVREIREALDLSDHPVLLESQP